MGMNSEIEKMSVQLELNASIRTATGTASSRRLRHEGKVPAVLYGTDKPNVSLTVDHNEIFHDLEKEAFLSAVIKINYDGKSEEAILREVQHHPFRQEIEHLDFQRVRADQALHIKVPLHFTGEEECEGVNLDGGIISHLVPEIDITCLPKDLPEFLELDITTLRMNQSLMLSAVALPEGVEVTLFAHGGEDQTVVVILPPKAVEEEVEESDVLDEDDLEAATEGEGEGEAEAEAEQSDSEEASS